MSDTPAISVVIPVRNGSATIAEQLDALSVQQVDVPWEIVVADNGSSDDTIAVIERHRVGALVPTRVVDASDRVGINHARNVGVRASRSPLIVFCDCDDRVETGWLSAYWTALGERGPAVGAGPLETGAINSDWAARHAGGLASPRSNGSFRWGWGANFAFHRSVWEQVGGFDEGFVGGFDEVDFLVRAQKAGAEFVWVDRAVVRYRLPATMRRLLARQFRFGRRSVQAHRLHADAVPGVSGRAAVRRTITYARRVVVDAMTGRASDSRIGDLAYAAGTLVEVLGRRFRGTGGSAGSAR